jgi:hypothetical protein
MKRGVIDTCGAEKHLMSGAIWAVNVGFMLFVWSLKCGLFVLFGIYHTILNPSRLLTLAIILIFAFIDAKFVYSYTKYYRFSDPVHLAIIASPLIYLAAIGRKSTKGSEKK